MFLMGFVGKQLRRSQMKSLFWESRLVFGGIGPLKGQREDLAEIGSTLDSQIVQHSPHRHGRGVMGTVAVENAILERGRVHNPDGLSYAMRRYWSKEGQVALVRLMSSFIHHRESLK